MRNGVKQASPVSLGFSFPGPFHNHCSLADMWATYLKLSDVLCLQKVRIYKMSNAGRLELQTVRAEAWGQQTDLKAAVKKFCYAPRGYDSDTQTQQAISIPQKGEANTSQNGHHQKIYKR